MAVTAVRPASHFGFVFSQLDGSTDHHRSYRVYAPGGEVIGTTPVPDRLTTGTATSAQFDMLDNDMTSLASGVAMVKDTGDESFIFKPNINSWSVSGGVLMDSRRVQLVTFKFVGWLGSAYDIKTSRFPVHVYTNVPEPTITDADLLAVHGRLNEYLGARSNWSDLIHSAWWQMIDDLGRHRGHDGAYFEPFEVATSAELAPLHLSYALQMVGAELLHEDGDRWGILAAKYEERYRTERDALLEKVLRRWSATYPQTESATDEARRVLSSVRHHGISRSSTRSTSENDSSPTWTKDTLL